VDERATALAVWRQAGSLIRRHPLATLLPAALLGMIIEVPYLLPDSQYILQDILALLTQAFAFYLYVAYAEEVTLEARRAEHMSLGSVFRRLLLAAPAVPLVMAASVAAITLPTVAATLLIVPGLWLLTHWSLFAAAIVREDLGPMAALRRSNELVEGRFELVFLTAAFAVILEEAVLGAGAYIGLVVSGSETWGEWAGGSVAVILILPLASFTTALTYDLLSHQE
jgi:hypothetical protein